MRVVIQRVSKASVTNEAGAIAAIDKGLLILLGIETNDSGEDVDYLVGKIIKLRIFDDSAGIMNLSVKDVSGGLLVVSQFTLHAETRKGNRPSYIRAARPEQAIPLYEQFVLTLSKMAETGVKTGWFGAHMDVSLHNDGPVTIIIDSKIKE